MSSCVMEQVRCFEIFEARFFARLFCVASLLLLLLLLLLLEDEEDAGESTDKAVLAEVPSSSSSSSSTAARFLPRPLVCLDAAAVVAFFFRVDMGAEFEIGEGDTTAR